MYFSFSSCLNRKSFFLLSAKFRWGGRILGSGHCARKVGDGRSLATLLKMLVPMRDGAQRCPWRTEGFSFVRGWSIYLHIRPNRLFSLFFFDQ